VKHGAAPSMEPCGLLGEVGVEVAHELGELLAILGSQQEVEVVGETRECGEGRGSAPWREHR